MYSPNQNYLLVLLFSLFVFGLQAKGGLSMDSLKQELAYAKEKDNWPQMAEATYLIGQELKKADEHIQCTEICVEMVAHAKERKTTYMLGDLIYLLGYSHLRLNHYEAALDYFMQMIELPTDAFKHKSIASAYNSIAKIYQDQGDYQKAYQYNMKVLSIYESTKDSTNIAETLYGIGSVLYYQENYQDALDYYERTLSIGESIDDQRVVYSSLGAIASIYIKTKHYDKSLEYNKRSLEIAEKLSLKAGVAYSLQNIGSTYEGMQNFREARKAFIESMKIKESVGDKWGLIGSYLALGGVNIKMGNHDESIEFLEKAQKLAVEIGSKPRTMEVYKALAESYESAGNLKKTTLYLKEFIALKDSIINESSLREMGDAKTRYEVQKREDKIALLTTEKALLQREQEIESLNFYLMGGSLIFLLSLTLIWFSRFRMQKRLVGLLEEKNDQIHRQNKQLELSNEDLQQFAYVASHDLKEPLRMISSYTTLLKKRYNQLFDDQAHEFMYYVVDAVGRMQTLLDDLLAYSRVETQAGNQKWVETTDILAMVTSNLRASIEEKKVNMKIHYDQLPRIEADPSQMIQLFQNLISNAIKFVDTDQPEVEVGFTTRQNKAVLYVKDNGIGIDEKSKAKIFEMFHRLHTREEFEGTGIGLATCKRIVDRHMGEIWVESEKGVGSTFFIALPEKSISESQLQPQTALAN